MRRLLRFKVVALVFAVFCASCSSPGQSVQTALDVDDMNKQALSVGIEIGDTQFVTFYVVNNTSSAISMLIWNTPFEKTLSADIFLVTHGVKKMPYLGRKVKRSSPGSSDYLVVPAGQKLEAEMDITKYYGLTESGEYSVTIDLPQIDGLTRLNQETTVTVESGILIVLVSQ